MEPLELILRERVLDSGECPGAYAVLIVWIVEEVGLRQREPEFRKDDKRGEEHAPQRGFCLRIFVPPDAFECLERSLRHNRNVGLGGGERERIEAGGMRRRIGIDE